MANSSLVNVTVWAHPSNYSGSASRKKVNNVCLHHMAGILTAKQCGDIFARAGRGGSAHYGIGSDGKIGLYVDEKNVAWHAGNWPENQCSVGIEISNDVIGGNWHVSDKSLELTIKLVADILKRNGIKEAIKGKTVTFHSMFAQTACVPLDTEVLTKNGWKTIADIEVGDEIAAPHMDNLSITFSPVLDKVDIKKQDTWTIRDLEVTADHRLIWGNSGDKMNKITEAQMLPMNRATYVPNAGQYKGSGLDLSDDEIKLLIAIQADGHYMYENRKYVDGVRIKTKDKKYYGIEFHLKKERKINAVCDLLDELDIDYNLSVQSNGTTKIRIYGEEIVAFAEKWLDGKNFTWDWLEMSPHQAEIFLDTLLEFDGCRAGMYYSSSKKRNIDVVDAIASLNGVGVRHGSDDRTCFTKPYRSLWWENKKRHKQQEVSCVTVQSGLILIRQNGRTTIIGNCPGDYVRSKMDYICAEVNKILKGGVAPAPAPVKDKFFPAKGYWGYGDYDARVGKIASFMHKTFPAYTKKAALGNWYGPNLKKAITEFQRRTKLEADGNVGPLTLKKLQQYGFKV